jgi:hypothetical protein
MHYVCGKCGRGHCITKTKVIKKEKYLIDACATCKTESNLRPVKVSKSTNEYVEE